MKPYFNEVRHQLAIEINKRQNEKICENCRWRSDEFTSVCCNTDSRHCADFVCADDTCDAFERREDKK